MEKDKGERQEFTRTQQGGPMKPGELCSSPDKPVKSQPPNTNEPITPPEIKPEEKSDKNS